VKISELNLSKGEEDILISIVGRRFNQNKKEIKIISNRFPNRLENKKYAILQLDKLIFEAKKIYKISKDE
jgi:hypothetical protein